MGSQPLEAREILEARYKEIETRFNGGPVLRPPFWGGFRVVPEQIEFWYGRPGRLHERELYARTASGWGEQVAGCSLSIQLADLV